MTHRLNCKIRQALIESEDGMTESQIASKVGATTQHARVAVSLMPDCYIDRWLRRPSGRGYMAVWMRADVPPNTPKPEKRTKAVKHAGGACGESASPATSMALTK